MTAASDHSSGNLRNPELSGILYISRGNGQISGRGREKFDVTASVLMTTLNHTHCHGSIASVEISPLGGG